MAWVDDKKSIRVLGVALSLLLVVVCVGTVGFVLIEGMSCLDAVYLSLVTISTLGMRDGGEAALGTGGKVWVMVMIVIGVAAAMIALSCIVGFIVEGHMRSILGRRKVSLKLSSLSNHIIVCGYGLMGQSLCEELKAHRADVVVVDQESSRTTKAETDGFLYILGDANDESILKAASIDKARAIITVLPTDAANVFVTLVARSLNPEIFIAARAERHENESRLLSAGANKAICPQVIGAKRLANIIVRPGVVDFMDFAAEGLDLEAEQFHIDPGSGLEGKTILQANLPRELGVLIVAIKYPDGRTVFNPEPDTVLEAGFTLFVTGRLGSMARLSQRYS